MISMATSLSLLLASAATNASLAPWQALAIAAALLTLALVLILLEFIIPSFGLLTLAATGCAVGAVLTAFQAGSTWGAGSVIAAPVLAIVAIRWGIQRLQSSRFVPQATINGDAGYHQYAERSGISIGSRGVLMTAPRPTARARFPDGVADVQVRGTLPEVGDAVVVQDIRGAIIFVVADSTSAP